MKVQEHLHVKVCYKQICT